MKASTQIKLPTKFSHRGPFILQQDDLEHLDQVVQSITDQLEAGNQSDIRDCIARSDNPTQDDYALLAIHQLEQSLPYSLKQNTVAVTSTSGTEIIGERLIDILQNRELQASAPTRLSLSLRRGECEFLLEISNLQEGSVTTDIRVKDKDAYSAIKYAIEKWISIRQPTLVTQWWSKYFPSVGILTLIVILLQFLSAFDNNDHYKLNIESKSKTLLADGVSPSEMPDALELLLRLAIEDSLYIQTSDADAKTIDYAALRLYSGLLAINIILMAVPKTTIGVGQNRRKARFWKSWIYFVMIFSPASLLLPVLISKLF